MDDILAVRSQMAMSLAFYIIFAVIGMPVRMCIAEWRWLALRRRNLSDVGEALGERDGDFVCRRRGFRNGFIV